MLTYSTMYQPLVDITMVLSSLCWLGWLVSSGRLSGVELLDFGFDGPAWLVGVAAMSFSAHILTTTHDSTCVSQHPLGLLFS